MKKYRQLLLILISGISVCLVLIYRHEYLQLRYVLEVLNYFGTPTRPQDIYRRSVLNWGQEPAWQRIDNNFYIYSAHRNLQKDTSTIKILGFGIQNAKPKFTCQFYFDPSESSLKNPQLGSFKYVILSQSDNYVNYMFICKQKQIFNKSLHTKIVPYGVAVGNSSVVFITDVIVRELDLTVCVLPHLEPVHTSYIIDFISHNQVLGIEQFIFYNNFVSSKLHRSLDYVASNINASFTMYPWNVPYPLDNNLIQELITQDCLLRTSGVSKFVLISKVNQFLVPKYSTMLLTILNSKSYKFTLKVIKFCRAFMPPQNVLLNSRHTLDFGPPEVFIYRNSGDNDGEVQHILDEDAEIYEYIDCVKEDTKTNTIAMNYAAKLNNAQLKILYDTGGLLIF